MRHQLPKAFLQKCKGCKHGRAAHKGDKACRMKHCTCKAFKT